MLSNEIYIGNLVQRQMEIVSYKVNKCRRVDKENRIRVENTHEPIIFDDSFEVFYDGYKNFFAVKVDKNSTDHTYYYSDNGS